MLSYIGKLRALLTRKNKLFLGFLLVFTIIFSILETVAVLAVMPFVTAASNPEYVFSNQYFSKLYVYFGFYSAPQFVVVLGLILLCFYLFRQLYVYAYNYMLNRFAYGRYHYFAYRLFSSYMSLPYEEFSQKNQAVMSKTIVDDAMLLSSMLFNALFIFSELMVILFLYIFLLMTNVKMTVVLTLVIVAQIVLMSSVVDRLVNRETNRKNEIENKFLKAINDSFGNFKLIKLLSSEKKIISEFKQSSSEYAKSSIQNNSLAILPKSILETVGLMLLVGSVVYVLLKYQYAHHVVPIISMYVLALYRILPSVSKVKSAYTKIVGGFNAIEAVYTDFSYESAVEGDEHISFENEIKLRKISFSYNGKWNVLHNLSMTIKKGQKIAIFGDSGSGKSTLVDIVMGIRKAQSGGVYIDDELLSEKNIRAWRECIGYIPKDIYLLDDSLARNVAFGYEVDEQKVVAALKQADVYELFSSKSGIYTILGENGMKLSGGQKLRISIARALYNNPALVVFEDDDAKLLSDPDTNAKIVERVFESSADKTLIVLTQNESLISKCDISYRVEKGKISKIV